MASPLIRGLFAYKADREARLPKPATIDVAIIVPDMRTARMVKRKCAVITPKNWKGSARMHVLLANDKGIDEEMRVFLASLRMFNPDDLQLVYPIEMEIGWSQEPIPLSESPVARSSTSDATSQSAT